MSVWERIEKLEDQRANLKASLKMKDALITVLEAKEASANARIAELEAEVARLKAGMVSSNTDGSLSWNRSQMPAGDYDTLGGR